MKIYYSPSFTGKNHLNLSDKNVMTDIQVLETQGLLTQLALHAGIHVEVPPYPIRLADYHEALMNFDKEHPDNLFHKSIEIDSMSVAKALLGWRDALKTAGWNAKKEISKRIDVLGEIEQYYNKESGLPLLTMKMTNKVKAMVERTRRTPSIYKELSIEVACPKDLLPDYIIPLFDSLEKIGVGINYSYIKKDDKPTETEIVKFSDQYKAEVWLSQIEECAYDVWINTDNKRLDNWLHMSGKQAAGSEMLQSNPQITQMFLLAVQLFERPLNVNSLLQYLLEPECPLNWELRNRLSKEIVREGGFCSDRVIDCINQYIEREYKEEGAEQTSTIEGRKESYRKYLPFDLCKKEEGRNLVTETDDVSLKAVKKFLETIKAYANKRAKGIESKKPYDSRIVQLKEVGSMAEALIVLISRGNEDIISFKQLQMYAQSLYDARDFCQYEPQVGSRQVINNPGNIVSKAKNTIWCDFYGDVNSTLSTDFLSQKEISKLQEAGIRLWNPDKEKAYHNFMMEVPLHQTTDKLTFVVCERHGTTTIPTHPLSHQLPKDINRINGDEEFAKLETKETVHINNKRKEDEKGIKFDKELFSKEKEQRKKESFSSLDSLLQTPLDYFLKYILEFQEKGLTEIKMPLTLGNVAHDTIEAMCMSHKGYEGLKEYVKGNFDSAFTDSLAKKGALLLLPEHHLDRDRLKHQLKRCVIQLAEILEANKLTIKQCEQKEEHNLGFDNGVIISGYIDMVLEDKSGNEVVFDMKWTSKKDKHANLIKKNHAIQLAIYQAMLMQHKQHPGAVRTAFFVMPEGKIVSSDQFEDCNFEHIEIDENKDADILAQIKAGYSERWKEFSEGFIETSYGMPIKDIDYSKNPDVLPLNDDGSRREPKKDGNEYSDYKCFTL